MPDTFHENKNINALEKGKFSEDSDNNIIVRTKLADSHLVAGVDYDAIDVTYPTDASEVYTYKLSAVTIRTFTITYTDSCKDTLLSMVVS